MDQINVGYGFCVQNRVKLFAGGGLRVWGLKIGTIVVGLPIFTSWIYNDHVTKMKIIY